MRRVGLITDIMPQETSASFVCPHCGKEFKSEAALRSHAKKTHPDAFNEEGEAYGRD